MGNGDRSEDRKMEDSGGSVDKSHILDPLPFQSKHLEDPSEGPSTVTDQDPSFETAETLRCLRTIQQGMYSIGLDGDNKRKSSPALSDMENNIVESIEHPTKRIRSLWYDATATDLIAEEGDLRILRARRRQRGLNSAAQLHAMRQRAGLSHKKQMSDKQRGKLPAYVPPYRLEESEESDDQINDSSEDSDERESCANWNSLVKCLSGWAKTDGTDKEHTSETDLVGSNIPHVDQVVAGPSSPAKRRGVAPNLPCAALFGDDISARQALSKTGERSTDGGIPGVPGAAEGGCRDDDQTKAKESNKRCGESLVAPPMLRSTRGNRNLWAGKAQPSCRLSRDESLYPQDSPPSTYCPTESSDEDQSAESSVARILQSIERSPPPKASVKLPLSSSECFSSLPHTDIQCSSFSVSSTRNDHSSEVLPPMPKTPVLGSRVLEKIELDSPRLLLTEDLAESVSLSKPDVIAESETKIEMNDDDYDNESDESEDEDTGTRPQQRPPSPLPGEGQFLLDKYGIERASHFGKVPQPYVYF